MKKLTRANSTSKNSKSRLKNGQNNKIYIVFFMVFIASFLSALILPIDEIFKGIATFPSIGALIGTLYQVLKDQAAFERQLELQRKQQFYSLGVTSHMANIAFDKHVEFCEKYMKEVHDVVGTLFREGPTQEALSHSAKLSSLRGDYAAWLTQDISSELIPFEKQLRELGRRAYLVGALTSPGDERREKAIQEMYELFASFGLEGLIAVPDKQASFIFLWKWYLAMQEKSSNYEYLSQSFIRLASYLLGTIDSDVAIESIKTKLRKILGVEELTQIRDSVIQEAVSHKF